MKKLKLLIVDDDDNAVQLLTDTLKEKQAEINEQDIDVEYFVSKNLVDSISQINNNDYDIAIVDLKLRADTILREGNEIIKEIKNKLQIPVFVLTNFKDDLEMDLRAENDIFSIKDRSTVDYNKLINEIIVLFKTGLTHLFGADGILEQKIMESIKELFWNRIATNWKYIVSKKLNEYERNRVVSRYLTMILEEKLNIDDMDINKSDAVEMYIIPPIKKSISTGDLVEYETEKYIVLNPACDLVIRKDGKAKASYLVMAKLISIKSHADTINCWTDTKFAKSQNLSDIIRNKKGRYHFLPPYNKQMGYIIDFEDIKRIDYLSKVNRIASISDPFLKNIISRFTGHYNRLGQPDFDEDLILKDLEEL